jgi:nitroreductase
MDAILSRRSIRKYTKEPVSESDIKELLEAAMSAPSAGNEQPWHFIVIRDRKILDEIPKFHQYAQMLKQAPVAILVCADMSNLKYESKFWAQDCSAATQNILIAAQDKGLGAVWLGIYPDEEKVSKVAKLVGTPEHITPFSMISIGHPGETKPRANRFDESRIHYNFW